MQKFMEILKNSKSLKLEQLTFLLEDSLVNPSAKQESEDRKKMTVSSGQRCCLLLKKQSQLGLLAKMLLESSNWHSNRCALIWKAKGMKSGRLLFQLAPSIL